MKTETKFQAGDVVALKSGGPKMTVEEIGSIFIRVVWIPKDGDKSEYDSFHPDCLEKAE